VEAGVLIGRLGAGVRDMRMAATLGDERRKALERHAVERFWCTIEAGRQGGAHQRAAPLAQDRGLPGEGV